MALQVQNSVASLEMDFRKFATEEEAVAEVGLYIYNVMQILKENGTLENHFGGCQRSD